MQDYPAFAFRRLMTQWDVYLEAEEKENKIKSLLDGQGLIMFFKQGSKLFGATEESRLTFARMKNPGDGDDAFMEKATFMATSLTGEHQKYVFNKKDLKSIKVVSREKCEKIMLKHASKPAVVTKGKQGKDHGFMKINDEE